MKESTWRGSSFPRMCQAFYDSFIAFGLLTENRLQIIICLSSLGLGNSLWCETCTPRDHRSIINQDPNWIGAPVQSIYIFQNCCTSLSSFPSDFPPFSQLCHIIVRHGYPKLQQTTPNCAHSPCRFLARESA